jgi:hypothetical protein
MWNPWKQLRIIGAFVLIGGSLYQSLIVSLLGFVIQYIGVIGAVDLLERRLDALTPKEKDDASN